MNQLTKLELFAMAAMSSIVAAEAGMPLAEQHTPREVADLSLEYAKALFYKFQVDEPLIEKGTK